MNQIPSPPIPIKETESKMESSITEEDINIMIAKINNIINFPNVYNTYDAAGNIVDNDLSFN